MNCLRAVQSCWDLVREPLGADKARDDNSKAARMAGTADTAERAGTVDRVEKADTADKEALRLTCERRVRFGGTDGPAQSSSFGSQQANAPATGCRPEIHAA
jgi:hypothetical protein